LQADHATWICCPPRVIVAKSCNPGA
jgi:hypothetical protein